MPFDDILSELSEDRTWRHLTHITEQIPSRLAGTPNARRMAEYAAENLADAGLDAQMDEFLGLVSFPKPAEVRVLAPEAWTIEASTLAQSPSTDGLVLDDLEVDVGLEQREPDLAHRLVDVVLGQRAPLAHARERALELL
jgi:hypothetical protein